MTVHLEMLRIWGGRVSRQERGQWQSQKKEAEIRKKEQGTLHFLLSINGKVHFVLYHVACYLFRIY